MNKNTQTKTWRRWCTGALAAGGMAAAALGLTSGTAQAAPHPAPVNHHHWCPGDHWDNGWGPYQNWNNCRDWDDNFGPAGWFPPPPWAPPMPPPPPWAPWAQVVWNAQFNSWGYWDGPVWRGL